MKIFLAGATGVIGRRLIPPLIEKGHQVTATSRTPSKTRDVEQPGVELVAMDGLDGASVGQAVARAEPDVIIHQMTALVGKPDLRRFDRSFARTNALRTIGTKHLLAAAQASGVKRFIAQSFTGWPNERSGSFVKTESDPLDVNPAPSQRISLHAIQTLERMVQDAPLDGIVLRYGLFYGPGASETMIEIVRQRRFPLIGKGTGVWSWIHVDDAASATIAALERGTSGIYSIVDDDPAPASEWLPYLAQAVGAKPPPHVPSWLARILAGKAVVQWMTEGRGSSNAKAKQELNWQPRWRSWREGFRHGLTDTPVARAADKAPV